MKRIIWILVVLLSFSGVFGAIAFDNSVSASSSTSTTVSTSMTVSGSNRILFVSVSDFGGDTVTGVTYNGDSLTQINKTILSGGTHQYLYYMVAPDTGTHTLQATRGSTTSTFKISASSYTGVAQTSPILNNGVSSVTSTGSITTTLNSISDNAWAVNGVGATRTLTASTGVTERENQVDNAIGDSGSAISPVQNYAMTWTMSPNGDSGAVMAIFAQAQDISFENISLNGANLVNDTILNTSTGEFNINLSVDGTNSDVNTTYFLYNTTSGILINTTQFGISTLQPNVTLGFDTGNYSISFFTENNQTNKSTGNFTFAVDTVPPLLSVTNNTEINFYNQSFDSIINVSDGTTSFTCLVTTDEGNVTTCSSTFYNWTTNGNHTFNVSVNDSAGNNAQSLNNRVFVNPNVTFTFIDSNGSQITNFEVNGESFVNQYQKPIYDIGLGTRNFTFVKTGFSNLTFTRTLNTTSNIDQNISIPFAQIIVEIFDRTSGNFLTQLVDVEILELVSGSTSNGSIAFQNESFPIGEYTVSAVSEGFYTEEKVIDYTGDDVFTIEMYLLNQSSNISSTLEITVTDEFFSFIQDADVRLLEYDNSTLGYNEVSQCFTNANGVCSFLIEVGTKTYRYTATTTIGGQIFSASSSIQGEKFQPIISGGEEIIGEIYERSLVLLVSDTLVSPNFFGLTIDAPENTNETIVSQNSTSTVITIPVTWSSSTGKSYEVCIAIDVLSGTNFNEVSLTCGSGASGTIGLNTFDLDRAFNYRGRVTVDDGNNNITYRTYTYLSNDSLSEVLEGSGWAENVILLYWIASLAVAIYLRNVAIWVYLAWIGAVIQGVLFPSLIFATANVLIILINAGVLYVSKKEVDLV